MSNETLGRRRGLEGRYRDRLIDPRRRTCQDRGWRSNLIVAECDRLLAALMKGEPGIGGIQSLAVGEGAKSWDSRPPRPAPDDTALHKEVHRLELAKEDIFFLDEQLAVTDIPSRRLEVHAKVLGRTIIAKGCRQLREFGLFGGHNGDTMVDYVIHPRIDLTEDARLERRVRLTFDNPLRPEGLELPPPSTLEQRLAVTDIDGVGDEYARRLGEHGIATIRALATLDVVTAKLDIPKMKLVELRAKARLALDTAAALRPIWGLEDCTVQQLLTRPIAELEAMASTSPPAVEELREQASALQLCLDHRSISGRTLAQLIEGS